MKIDSSKLPAWQPGRAPAGRGDPAAPGAPARAPGRGSGAAGICGKPAGQRPPPLSQRFRRGGSNLPREKRPYPWPSSSSNKFPTSPKRCPLLQTRSGTVSTLKASIIVPRAGRVPIVARIAFDVLYLMPLQAKRQANTECPVTRDLITAECILHAD